MLKYPHVELVAWGYFFMFLLYVLTFTSGKKYVGITTTSLKRRLSSHRNCVRIGDDRAVYAAWRKYGEPHAEVVCEYQTRDELIQAEIDTIKSMGTLTPGGYNMAEGICNFSSQRPEVAAKISAANRGKPKPPRSEEHCRNIALSKLGKKRIPRTQAHKDALSASRKGIEFSDEWRANIGRAQIGRKQSDDTKERRKSTWANRTPEQNAEMARKRAETRAKKGAVGYLKKAA